MGNSTAMTEQKRDGRRVSRHPDHDREMRERRRDKVAALLLRRTSYRQIIVELAKPEDDGGLDLDVALGTVTSDAAVIRERWHRRMVESFAAHVSEQMAYYDALLATLTPEALKGDHDAVRDLLSVLDRRARLVGMEAPDKVLVAHRDVGPDVEEKWRNAPREEQIARTEQILAIVMEANPLRLEGGPPLRNADADVIDLVERLDPEE